MHDSSTPERPQAVDWALVRAFLAVVEAGSLTAAAVTLGVSQPTLSRQVAALEASIGSPLFERVGRGLRLTAAGQALTAPARQMQTAANEFAVAALGQSRELAGSVRLTASEMTAAFVLPQILSELRRRHPEIQLELAVSNRLENLLEGEADIAVRHARPKQGGLVARRLGELRLGAFAHESYLARVGGRIDPATPERYDWIGLDRSDLLLRGFRRVGWKVGREFFAVRCDDQVAGWQMAVAGMGIGFGTHIAARACPGMREVLPAAMVPPLPVWLSTRRELRGSARMRVVFDHLAVGLQALVAQEGAG